MLFRHPPALLILLAMGVLPGFAQIRPSSGARSIYSIAGTVRDDKDQHAMENVRVDLKQSTGVTVNTTFTRGIGEFEFDGLTNGEYIVEVNEKDYEPFRQSVSVLDASIRGVSIFLTRPMKVVNSSSGASISAHQLSVPHKARDEFDKGIDLLYRKSDYREAIVQFQRAIKDFPTYYEAYAEEGAAFLRVGEMASAEEALRKSVDLSSEHYSEALVELSVLLTDTNRYSDAVTFARKAVELDATSWRGYYELARVLLRLNQLEEADKSAIQARNLKLDNPSVYLMLANIHIQQHNYPALLSDLDSYLRLVPTGPEAEQARSTQIQLQADMKVAEDQARVNAQGATRPNAQNSSASSAAPAPEAQGPPPPEPDLSGLPSLPPPSASNQ